jgi:hypothetical protein
VQKVQINPRTTAKDLVQMKGRSARKKPLLQNRHKKPDYSLQLHMGTKIVLFGENPLV